MAGGGWKLARSRGSLAAQLPLAMCIVLAVVIALLGRAEASIFDAARARLTDWSSPALAQLRTPLSGLEKFVGGIGNIFNVYGDNERLKRENTELKKWQNVALLLEQRVKRYELLLEAVPDPQLISRTAHVIGQSNRPFIRTLVLNGGTDNRIRKGQAVLDDSGLIGRIYVSGTRTSWVLLLSDPNSRVPVVILPSNRRAILAGDNTNAPVLELDVGERPVNPGDRIVSTGDGGLLPPDLPIGVVMKDGDGLRVALSADPGISDYVHVVDYQPQIAPPPTTIADLPPVHRPAAKLPIETISAAPAAPAPAPAAEVVAKPVPPRPAAALAAPRAIAAAELRHLVPSAPPEQER
jgi:rod shape-determining protein MreC